MKKIAVGLSGGVDSSAAAHILLEKGYDVMGIILRLKPENAADSDIADAQRVADKLGIELRVLDRRDFFKKSVIDPFVAEYLAARTPNPCIECNYAIKFGAMLNYALENGCDGIATGHYARIEKSGGRYLLKRSESAKDQSYFLYRLSQFQLSHSIFPLEGMEKSFIRDKAEAAGIHVAEKRDSQEICFVPNDDYISYLSSLGITSPKGDFVDKQGNILGEHNGIINYTIGQRKGLGAFGKPMFVTGISAEDNTVTIGENGSQYSQKLVADRMNWIAFDNLDEPIRAEVKIRFRAKEQPALVTPNADGTVTVVFDEPQRSVTPGQSAVIYDGNTVLGGGRIIKSE
ncbi:MAG: tRNA 2-thiouridine(34) synthase MnmA [Ruminococcaceae bacterium]|nr:tRNA 2-thiouridine(34) synthase MnmA [Oscillospiraceae bacterium]